MSLRMLTRDARRKAVGPIEIISSRETPNIIVNAKIETTLAIIPA